jgi:SAM-dependent methyltransferase
VLVAHFWELHLDLAQRLGTPYAAGMSAAISQTQSADAAVVAGAERLALHMLELDRAFRRAGVTVPSMQDKAELQAEFWAFASLMADCEHQGASRDSSRVACRELLGRWLFRSRYWSRAYHKPHGYAGDFRMIEWLYDLEGDPCADPTQPAIVNCMDFLMSTVHSTRMLWERRRWFADALARERERLGGKLRILDVAAGGARYLRDFLLRIDDTRGIEISIVDQDATAIAFCRGEALAAWTDRVKTYCLPIRQLGDQLTAGPFDVILCAGLLDYLSEEAAAGLLRHLSSALAPGGRLTFSNFHPSDPSRFVKDWLVDWPLLFRTEEDCRRLLPTHLAIESEGSSDATLVFASGCLL